MTNMSDDQEADKFDQAIVGFAGKLDDISTD